MIAPTKSQPEVGDRRPRRGHAGLSQAERVVMNLLSGLRGDLFTLCTDWMTDDVLWINSGLPACRGIDACMDLVEAFLAGGLTHVDSQVAALSSDEDLVFTQHRAVCLTASGSPRLSIAVHSTYRVRGNRVSAWLSVFDPGELDAHPLSYSRPSASLGRAGWAATPAA